MKRKSVVMRIGSHATARCAAGADATGRSRGIETSRRAFIPPRREDLWWRAHIPDYERNRLLAVLLEGDRTTLSADLQDMELAPAAVIFEPGQPITHVYFPFDGIVSLIIVGSDGSGAEAATIGNEGVIGLGGLLAGDASFTRQVVKLAGRGVRIARAPFLRAVDRSQRLRNQLAAHADAFTAQLIQSVACNARHSVEQRLARWLLTTSDRSGQDHLPFTHHAVADMLAVQRPTVTLIARMMQSAGLIDCRRGAMMIVDRPGLQSVCCECYGIIQRAYDFALRAENDRRE